VTSSYTNSYAKIEESSSNRESADRDERSASDTGRVEEASDRSRAENDGGEADNTSADGVGDDEGTEGTEGTEGASVQEKNDSDDSQENVEEEIDSQVLGELGATLAESVVEVVQNQQVLTEVVGTEVPVDEVDEQIGVGLKSEVVASEGEDLSKALVVELENAAENAIARPIQAGDDAPVAQIEVLVKEVVTQVEEEIVATDLEIEELDESLAKNVTEQRGKPPK
jgi:hypothetical protein